MLAPLADLNPRDFETALISKATIAASRCTAELKGAAATIPNQGVLINTLALQETKDSSAQPRFQFSSRRPSMSHPPRSC